MGCLDTRIASWELEGNTFYKWHFAAALSLVRSNCAATLNSWNLNFTHFIFIKRGSFDILSNWINKSCTLDHMNMWLGYVLFQFRMPNIASSKSIQKPHQMIWNPNFICLDEFPDVSLRFYANFESIWSDLHTKQSASSR